MGSLHRARINSESAGQHRHVNCYYGLSNDAENLSWFNWETCTGEGNLQIQNRGESRGNKKKKKKKRPIH